MWCVCVCVCVCVFVYLTVKYNIPVSACGIDVEEINTGRCPYSSLYKFKKYRPN